MNELLFFSLSFVIIDDLFSTTMQLLNRYIYVFFSIQLQKDCSKKSFCWKVNNYRTDGAPYRERQKKKYLLAITYIIKNNKKPLWDTVDSLVYLVVCFSCLFSEHLTCGFMSKLGWFFFAGLYHYQYQWTFNEIVGSFWVQRIFYVLPVWLTVASHVPLLVVWVAMNAPLELNHLSMS